MVGQLSFFDRTEQYVGSIYLNFLDWQIKPKRLLEQQPWKRRKRYLYLLIYSAFSILSCEAENFEVRNYEADQ